MTGDLVIQKNQEVARLSAGQLARELDEYTGVLESLARLPDLYGGAPATQRAALKAASNRLVVFDAGVVLLDNHGLVTAAEPPRPDIVGQDWSARAYFRQMARTPGPLFSDVVGDGPGGAGVIVAAVPMLGSQGEFRGLAAGMFRVGVTTVSAFYGSIVKLRLGGGETAYLVDHGGRVIYHADTDRIGEDFSDLDVVRAVTAGRTGALRTRDVAGRDIVASYAPVPGTPWGLVTEVELDKLLAGNDTYRRFLFLLLALGVLIPAAVVAVASRRITQPITDLIGAAQEVAGGKFGQTLQATTGDEAGGVDPAVQPDVGPAFPFLRRTASARGAPGAGDAGDQRRHLGLGHPHRRHLLLAALERHVGLRRSRDCQRVRRLAAAHPSR